MSVINLNINDRNSHPPHKKGGRKKIVAYSAIKRPVKTGDNYKGRGAGKNNLSESRESNTRITTNRIPRFEEPSKAYIAKQQVSFQGSFFSAASSKKAISGQKLVNDILYYLDSERNTLVKAVVSKAKEYKLENDNIRQVMPFHENLKDAFLALPLTIYRKGRALFDRGFREYRQGEEAKAEAKNGLLGLWTHVDRFAQTFDKGLSKKEDLAELKTILGDKNTPIDKEKLSKFFAKRKLERLYNHSETSPKGLLHEENSFESFKNAILNDDEKTKEDFKKSFVNLSINKAKINKQGSFFSTQGQNANQLMVRLITGVIPAYFIANDFYNLRILNADNKKKADQEWKSKFGQESFRVGIEAYEGFLTNSVFERITNKSLPTAVGLNIVNYIGSNIFSRVFTNRPVLPVDVDKAVSLQALNKKKNENNEEVKENKTPSNIVEEPVKTTYSDKYKTLNIYKVFKGNNSLPSFGANNNILTPIKNLLTSMDKIFEKALPAKMNWEKFKEGYKAVERLDKEDAVEMLTIVNKSMKLGLEHTQLNLENIDNKLAEQGLKEVKIGQNWVYRYSKILIDVIKLPVNVIVGLGRFAVNSGRKIFGLPPIKPEKKSSYLSEQFVKNVTKWAEKAEKENPKDLEAAQVHYGSNKKFFSTSVMEYGAEEISSAMKLTGFFAVPFLASDAYNVTLGETRNKDIAKEKAKQRSFQDSVRQGVSFWICYLFNQMGKALSNSSLLGNALVVGAQAYSYETATRVLVGQPVNKTTHEEMVKSEKEKAKSNNWFVKIMAGKLKTNSATNLTIDNNQNTNPVGTLNTQPSVLTPQSSNVADLYKKFSSN